jgi:hypothetical protein
MYEWMDGSMGINVVLSDCLVQSKMAQWKETKKFWV